MLVSEFHQKLQQGYTFQPGEAESRVRRVFTRHGRRESGGRSQGLGVHSLFLARVNETDV